MATKNGAPVWRGDLSRISRFFDALFSGPSALNPAVDIEETEQDYILTFDLPGIQEPDISVEVRDHQLVLAGERHQVEREGQMSQHRLERYYGEFERAFSLPPNADIERIDAKYADGVLTIVVPKTQSAHSKRIHIQWVSTQDKKSEGPVPESQSGGSAA